jgi:predicted tellurium resistance membrane protein TerC
MIEWSDLIFAIDSILAVFAVSLDPFIVFTSNIFAIMGLRALYFLLANVMGLFVYLKFGVSFILLFVGCKMLAAVSGFPSRSRSPWRSSSPPWSWRSPLCSSSANGGRVLETLFTK